MEGDHELMLAQLVSLGFELEAAIQALENSGGSLEAAIDYLTQCARPAVQSSSCSVESRHTAEKVQRSPAPYSSQREEESEEVPMDQEEEELDGDWSDGEEVDTYVQDAIMDLRSGKVEEEMIELVKPDLDLVVEGNKLLTVIEKTIADTAETLQLSFGEAARVLKKYRWNQETVYEQYFANPQLFAHADLPGRQQSCSKCPVCDQVTDLLCIDCGHSFCKDDWSEHIETKLQNNEADQISCMQAGCPCLVVDSDFVRRVVNPRLYQTFMKFIVQKVVDTHPLWKRCPAPGCNYVLKLDGSKKDVRCLCNFPVCILCNRESHVPCTCEQLVAWEKKNKSESENTNWILVNTQMCPKCKWPIEKNGGCNHMTCRQCNYEFCWICRGNWNKHTSCNAYPDNAEAKKIEQAKESLDRYIHFYQRYEAHEKSKQLDTNLRQSAIEQMMEMFARSSVSNQNLELISKATENVIECRRILKYTYVFGFYYTGPTAEKQLFEFLQAELERSTEELSGRLESRLGIEMLEDIRGKSNTAAK